MTESDNVFDEWRSHPDPNSGQNLIDSFEKGIEMLNGRPLYEMVDGMTDELQRQATNAHAASQNNGAGRQKKHTVYCNATMGIHTGCQNELPALQGHGNGGSEKTTKCNNSLCAWYNMKQIFDADDKFLRFCTIPRGPIQVWQLWNV